MLRQVLLSALQTCMKHCIQCSLHHGSSGNWTWGNAENKRAREAQTAGECCTQMANSSTACRKTSWAELGQQQPGRRQSQLFQPRKACRESIPLWPKPHTAAPAAIQATRATAHLLLNHIRARHVWRHSINRPFVGHPARLAEVTTSCPQSSRLCSHNPWVSTEARTRLAAPCGLFTTSAKSERIDIHSIASDTNSSLTFLTQQFSNHCSSHISTTACRGADIPQCQNWWDFFLPFCEHPLLVALVTHHTSQNKACLGWINTLSTCKGKWLQLP